MNHWSLPEYDGEPGERSRLLVLVRCPQGHGRSALIADFEHLGATVYAYDPYLGVLGNEETESNRFLYNVRDCLAAGNRQGHAAEPIEIIETRMVNRDFAPPPSLFEIAPGIAVSVDHGQEEKAQDHCLFLSSLHVFGSGLHPSTRLAARALVDCAESAPSFPARVLDVGTGSGILAMVCGLLGSREIIGTDISEDALEVARENVKRNELSDRIIISSALLNEVEGKFDLVVANVTPAVMTGMAGDLSRLVGRKGNLVLSGFQGRQADNMVELFGVRGFAMEECYGHGRWRALRLIKSG